MSLDSLLASVACPRPDLNFQDVLGDLTRPVQCAVPNQWPFRVAISAGQVRGDRNILGHPDLTTVAFPPRAPKFMSGNQR